MPDVRGSADRPSSRASGFSVVRTRYFHAAAALHGSSVFKLLDDSAWCAAQSVSLDKFVVTATYHTHILRPVSKGGTQLTGSGRVVNSSSTTITAESVVTDQDGKLIATGSGSFMRSSAPLTSLQLYADVIKSEEAAPPRHACSAKPGYSGRTVKPAPGTPRNSHGIEGYALGVEDTCRHYEGCIRHVWTLS